MARAALVPRHVTMQLSPIEATDVVMLLRAGLREFDYNEDEAERIGAILAAMEEAMEPQDETGRPMGNLPQLRSDEDGGSAVAV